MDAKANVQVLAPQYKSGSEAQFALLGRAILREHFDVAVGAMFYEPCRWKIPGGHYTPDFMAILEDGRVVFVEVKGSRKQKGYRDARSKLRAAAEIYKMFTWIECVEQDGWTVEVIGGSP